MTSVAFEPVFKRNITDKWDTSCKPSPSPSPVMCSEWRSSLLFYFHFQLGIVRWNEIHRLFGGSNILRSEWGEIECVHDLFCVHECECQRSKTFESLPVSSNIFSRFHSCLVIFVSITFSHSSWKQWKLPGSFCYFEMYFRSPEFDSVCRVGFLTFLKRQRKQDMSDGWRDPSNDTHPSDSASALSYLL